MFCVGGAPYFLTCPTCLKSHNFYAMKLAQSFGCFTSCYKTPKGCLQTGVACMRGASLTGLQSHILTSRPPRDCKPFKCIVVCTLHVSEASRFWLFLFVTLVGLWHYKLNKRQEWVER
ncbi:unnamed protein product [Ixodes pacificus]